MNAAQCRAARAMLGMTTKTLAAMAKVSPDTVVRFENGGELKERTVEDLQRALSTAGVIFIDDEGEPGVKLRARPD